MTTLAMNPAPHDFEAAFSDWQPSRWSLIQDGRKSLLALDGQPVSRVIKSVDRPPGQDRVAVWFFASEIPPHQRPLFCLGSVPRHGDNVLKDLAAALSPKRLRVLALVEALLISVLPESFEAYDQLLTWFPTQHRVYVGKQHPLLELPPSCLRGLQCLLDFSVWDPGLSRLVLQRNAEVATRLPRSAHEIMAQHRMLGQAKVLFAEPA